MVSAVVDDAALLYSRVYCQNQHHSKSVAEDSFGSTMAIASPNLLRRGKIVLFSFVQIYTLFLIHFVPMIYRILPVMLQ